MSQLLTFSTAGSVDDGKSTLLGRLVHDTQGLLTDNAAAIQVGEEIDFSRLTDGLVAEREQGITIDVAWRHLKLEQRRYLMADAPGHEQYTRNLITAASHAHALIILVDPTRLDLSGISPTLLKQTIRHSAIAHLLRVSHVSFVVNKLDLFPDAAEVFEKVCRSLNLFVKEIGLDQTCQDIEFIAASALTGENIAARGPQLAWFKGLTLLEWLSCVSYHIESQAANVGCTILPIQTSLRTQGSERTPFRGVAGRLAQGVLVVGDAVTVIPGDRKCTIARLLRHGKEQSTARASESIAVVLDQDVDASRGDFLIHTSAAQNFLQADVLTARLCWLAESPGVVGARLVMKIGSREVQARIVRSLQRFEPETLDFREGVSGDAQLPLSLNEIHDVIVQLAEPIFLDQSCDHLNALNRFVLMHAGTWATVAAGVITGSQIQ